MNFALQFGQIITAMVTPLTQDGSSIDYNSLEILLKYLSANSTSSILITGTTGENPTLTHTEEYELLQSCVRIIKDQGLNLPIIFGAGSNSTSTAIEVAQHAQKYGVDAVLSVTPYYNKPNQEGMYAHFESIAQNIDIPIMIYNNPGRTASYIEPDVICALNQKYSNIIALKESSGRALDTINKLNIAKSQKQLSNDFGIYIGDDSLIIPTNQMNCAGVVSVASHMIGNIIQDIIQNNNYSAFLEYYELFDLLFASPSPGPIKYVLEQLQIIKSSTMRLPLTPPNIQVQAKLDIYISQLQSQ